MVEEFVAVDVNLTHQRECHAVVDAAELGDLLVAAGLLGAKYFPEGYDMAEDIRKNGPRAAILDLRIEHMSGKQVREK